MSHRELGRFQKDEVRDWSSMEHKVVDVIDGATGQLLSYRHVLSGTRADVFERRSRAKASINSEAPAYRCSYCHQPVSIASTKDRGGFFFRHRPHEGPSCPYENKAPLTHEEVRARQYNGAKESTLHQHMKEILRQSLEADELVQKVWVEGTVKGIAPGTRRKPDVRALLKDGRTLVFEVQLSSTFIDVMKERLAFYQENNAILIWVFANANIDDPRIVLEDVFYTNNRNIFVANESTLAASLSRGACVLQCLYVTPRCDRFGDDYTSSWRDAEVLLSELRSSEDEAQTYWYDFGGEKVIARETWRQGLVGQLTKCWRDWFNSDESKLRQEEWDELCEVLMRHAIELPEHPRYISDDATARISGILSALHGESVGFRYKKLINVAHYLYDQAAHGLLAFGHALRVYSTFDLLADEDKTGKWAKKQRLARAGLKAREEKYMPAMSIDEWRLYVLLFPEMVEALPTWCAPSKEYSLIPDWYQAMARA